jgi:hypothetical protein
MPPTTDKYTRRISGSQTEHRVRYIHRKPTIQTSVHDKKIRSISRQERNISTYTIKPRNAQLHNIYGAKYTTVQFIVFLELLLCYPDDDDDDGDGKRDRNMLVINSMRLNIPYIYIYIYTYICWCNYIRLITYI